FSAARLSASTRERLLTFSMSPGPRTQVRFIGEHLAPGGCPAFALAVGRQEAGGGGGRDQPPIARGVPGGGPLFFFGRGTVRKSRREAVRRLRSRSVFG